MLFGWYVGHWLDVRYFGDRGWATFIGASFGIAAAFKAIYDASQRARRRLEEIEREERDRADRNDDDAGR
ncbi:MAG: hypothetical protein HYV09_10115 [Deltaproteobacteria bacterium]|nr:hypothetical protein [Deltaproteobacteria bacterium]